ncbi:hypothetical protein F5J12DRAFT_906814 [Pisolithus orientalis]|uniref:uncharacterized protein n=1 Tax=Pisolithus orientalis TaxID=936130 RepID=UPI002225340D|nr:uncharacterized protein F5J12DRAFT_906814 [Pisolithus orientalis]KAI5999437.1 hypothetical protein F5J12DRAFT_906814 [Pisolithus orientalis]
MRSLSIGSKQIILSSFQKCFCTEDCTLNSYKNLESSWQAASHHMTAFQKSVISAPFAGKMMEFDMYYHLLWDWACNLLKDSNVGPYFPWTANDVWNVQSGLPSDGKVLAFIMYANKSKLSSFGQQKGYLVGAWIANLPTWIHNGEGLGGGQVVMWLLIVKEDKRYSGKKLFANFKNHVWHESFKKILDMISEYSNTSFWQAVMALMHSVMSNYPCPICLIPHEEISKFPTDCEHHTSENVFKTLQEACLQNQADHKEQILAKQGLHDVDLSCSCYYLHSHSDPFQMLCWDRLHANCAGKFGDHLWGELMRILETMGCQTMGKVEWNLSTVLRWHGLNHFEEALLVSYTDGQKFEDLSKPLYLLLHCLHACIEFDMYTALELHTTHTLATGQEVLVIFDSLMKKYAEETQYTGKNWNFPKNHTWMHVFNDIKAKGVTHNFNTKPNEKMHGPLKEAYQKQTNFKNVAQQILHINHLGLVCKHIHCKITEYNTYMLTTKATHLGNLEADEPEEEFFHIKLGSKMKEPLTFEDMGRKSTTDNVFSQFWGKLSEFLNKHFDIAGEPLPGGKHIQFQMNEKIMEFCFVKVNFESTVDWCQYTDYLHCHPNFHGCPHYDCVLIKTQQKDMFGQLVLLFQCIVVHSIIHGALLYPDHMRPVDTDMVLCVQMMHKAAGHL